MCKNCIIDTHSHLWTSSYLNKLKVLGSKGTDIAQGIGALNSKEDLEKRFKMMDNAGVTHQVLSATPQVPQYGNPKEALELAKEINDEYLKIVKKYPNRFRAYGVVPLPHVKEAIEEGKRIINELGFLGIALNTLLDSGKSLIDEDFEPFFEEMNKLKAIIYVHPTGCGALSSMVNDSKLEWVVGAPIEDMVATLQLLKEDFPRKYPDIKFHIAHLGGGISFQMQRIMDNFEIGKLLMSLLSYL